MQIVYPSSPAQLKTDKAEPKRSGLDRRTNRRRNKKAEILTFHNEARLHKSAVIDCSDDGARIVLGHDAAVNDTIGVIVISEGRRWRTFARVAWVKKLNPSTTVAGLQFFKLDYHKAS